MKIDVCPYCGSKVVDAVDKKGEYFYRCENNLCVKPINLVVKKDFLKTFECPECGGLSGELEENDVKLGVRCNNCKKLTIVLEKETTINRRNEPSILAPKCPRCNSTKFSTTARGANGLFGFIGASKTVNRCSICGHTWTPKKKY